jgi:hypothetical protein
MSTEADRNVPVWEQPPPEDEALAEQTREAKERYLLLDVRPPEQVQEMVLEPMRRTGPIFWGLLFLLGLAAAALFAMWAYQMYWGIGVTGLNRPVMWAIYIANFVYFIGIGVAGTPVQPRR